LEFQPNGDLAIWVKLQKSGIAVESHYKVKEDKAFLYEV